MTIIHDQVVPRSWQRGGPIPLASGIITTGISLALYLRSRQEKHRVGPSVARMSLGGTLEQQVLATERSIEQYQQLALEQARISFGQSQRAMGVALVLLVAGAVSVSLVPNRPGQFLVGGLAAFGSGFSAFLSKTFLDVFRQSIYQLNHSHSIPITKNLVILANTLATNPGVPPGRDGLVKDVVAAALDAVPALNLDRHSGSRKVPWRERRAQAKEAQPGGESLDAV